MRVKRPYVVLSFRATVEAMAFEQRSAALGVPGRLIPLPREISAGCGLAWRMLPEEWQLWQPRLAAETFDAANTVMQ